jgi:hypothetical protein
MIDAILRLIQLRITALLLTYLAAGGSALVARGYLDSTNADAMQTAIAYGVGAFVLAALHKWLATPTGAKVREVVAKILDDRQEPPAPGGAIASAPFAGLRYVDSNNAYASKKAWVPPTVKLTALILACSLMFAGCPHAQPIPETPADAALRQVMRAQVAYIVVATGLEVAHNRGDISDATFENVVKPGLTLAVEYLHAAEEAAEKGEPMSTEAQLRLFEKTLATVADILAPPPATRPAK